MFDSTLIFGGVNLRSEDKNVDCGRREDGRASKFQGGLTDEEIGDRN